MINNNYCISLSTYFTVNVIHYCIEPVVMYRKLKRNERKSHFDKHSLRNCYYVLFQSCLTLKHVLAVYT